MVLTLVKNPDILQELGSERKNRFSLDLLPKHKTWRNMPGKMQQKNLDFILANDITESGAGFMNDTNKGVSLLMKVKFEIPYWIKTSLPIG